MGRTSILIDSSTKDLLDGLKRDGETWDEFLTRITADEEPIKASAWSTDEAERAKGRVRESRATSSKRDYISQ